MIKRPFLFVLVCTFFVPLGLMAKEKRGADIIIQKTDGQQLSGELVAVRCDSLLILNSNGADITFKINNIRNITIIKKAKLLKGMGWGLFIGGGVGFGLGKAMETAETPDWEYLTMPVGAGIGLLVGGIISSASGKDKTIQIEGKSDSEIQAELEKLRKKARIPDYQ
jgi:hypothetical protein